MCTQESLFQMRAEFRPGLAACAENWYGRSQVLSYATQGQGKVTMMLDGAHTPDSIRAMGSWYYSKATAAEGEGGGDAPAPSGSKVLLFFCGAEREPADLLSILHETQVEASAPDFKEVLFTVNNFHPSRRKSEEGGADLSWQETLAKAWASDRVQGGGEVRAACLPACCWCCCLLVLLPAAGAAVCCWCLL
jgi:folylpolyglutamate synthase/dihydropteroate synthase